MTKKSKKEPEGPDLEKNGFIDYVKSGSNGHIKGVTSVFRMHGGTTTVIINDGEDFKMSEEQTARFIELMKTEFCRMLKEQASYQRWNITPRQVSLLGHEMARHYNEVITIEYIDRNMMMDIIYRIMNNKGYPIIPGKNSTKQNTRRGTK